MKTSSLFQESWHQLLTVVLRVPYGSSSEKSSTMDFRRKPPKLPILHAFPPLSLPNRIRCGLPLSGFAKASDKGGRGGACNAASRSNASFSGCRPFNYGYREMSVEVPPPMISLTEFRKNTFGFIQSTWFYHQQNVQRSDQPLYRSKPDRHPLLPGDQSETRC